MPATGTMACAAATLAAAHKPADTTAACDANRNERRKPEVMERGIMTNLLIKLDDYFRSNYCRSSHWPQPPQRAAVSLFRASIVLETIASMPNRPSCAVERRGSPS